MNERQTAQIAFEQRGENIVVGMESRCPLTPQQLAAIEKDSPFVVQVIQSGLTAEVFHLRIAGHDYTLKKKRHVAKVSNIDGQFSFLNEVQRRQDFARLQANAAHSGGLGHIVDTVYADYRLGIILSPWIEGTHVENLTVDLIRQLLWTLLACEQHGLMEWDLCSGNLLVDNQQQLWLFDFGYMYPFNPLSELNSNGMSDPLFHAVERFETRFFFGWLLQSSLTYTQQMALYRQMKQVAIEVYAEKCRWLKKNRAQKAVLSHYQSLVAAWKQALHTEVGGMNLFLMDGFRSHVLDIEDDLHGQSCTPLTLQRIDNVIGMVEEAYDYLRAQGGLFYQNAGKSQSDLLDSYREKRVLALSYQVS